MIVAEQTRRFDTIGIDCVAMNVNDLICVGAEPLALLDYIAVERAEPRRCFEASAAGCGGRRAAGVEIPGGEVCQVPEVLRGHPSPYGFDLVGSAFGMVELDTFIDGSACRAGDALIGLPASGVHSNGMTLARRALLTADLRWSSARARRRDRRRRAARADDDLRPGDPRAAAQRVEVHGLAHITGGGLMNLLRIGEGVGYSITGPLPVPPVFELIAERGRGRRRRDVGGVQHGLRVLCDRRRPRRPTRPSRCSRPTIRGPP